MRTAITVFVLYLGLASAVFAQNPYGLDTRPYNEPYNGYRLPTNAQTLGKGPIPMLLSQTGVFETTSNLIPSRAMIPYTVNSALWSDSSAKYRWMCLPKTPLVGFTPSNWAFPPGSVFVKHFDLTNAVGPGNTVVTRRLETRLLVLDYAGDAYGITYIWKPDNSDAVLAPAGGADSNIVVKTSSGTATQEWHFPSQKECLQCHKKLAYWVLGPKTPQLNGNYTYPNTNAAVGSYNNPQGVTDNQLRTLNHIGIFANGSFPGEGSIPTLPKMAGLSDTTATLETRARSYLDANCAHCHRVTNPAKGSVYKYDANFMTPFGGQKIVNTDKIKFGQPGDSDIYNRDGAELGGMPDVGRNLVDTNWIPFLQYWISNAFNALSAASTVSNQVTVTFNGNVDTASATTLANYSLQKNDASATYTISGATANGKVVTLTISTPLPASTAYKLTVNNVLDQLSPQDRSWPNRVLNFNTPAAGPTKNNENGPPPNDNFAAAIALSGGVVTTTANNCNGTKEAGEPDHAGNPGGASAWWSWTAPTNGFVSIDTLGSDFDTLLAVYTGNSLASLNVVTANNDFDEEAAGAPDANSASNLQASRVTFTAVQGTTYMIAVDGDFDGYNLSCGNIVLNINQGALPLAPANDLFANAILLTGSAGSATGTNTFATKETGEPVVAGDEGGASVWWAWTAPADGNVQIDTHGSSFDTILGVFVGTNVASLVSVAENDDDEANGLTTSLVQFAVANGVTYYISVDGYEGTTGNIMLNYAYTPSAVALPPVVNLQPLLSSETEFVMELSGPAGAIVDLQATSDLSNWSAIGRYILSGNSLRVSDPITGSNQQRFYRAVRYLDPPPGQ